MKRSSAPPTDADAEHRVLVFDIEPAWGTACWLHARHLESGRRVQYLLLGHEPHMYCEPGADALNHSAVTDVEYGHESVDGDELVKLTLTHPGRTNKIRDELCENPHEADTPYILRTAIDTEAWGICRIKGERVKAGLYKTRPEWIEQETRQIDETLDVVHFDIEGGNTIKVDSAPDPIYCMAVLDPRYDRRIMFSYRPNEEVEVTEYETITGETRKVDEHRHFTDTAEEDGERAMLRSFIDWLETRKPEAIAGYYSNSFDIPYIINRARKLGIPSREWWGGHGDLNADYANIPGVQCLDLYEIHDTATYGGLEEGDELETVLEEFTGIEKEDHGEEVTEMWENDPQALFEYNFQDVEATYKIDQVQRYSLVASSLMFLTYTMAITDTTKVSDLYYGLFLEEAKERGEALPQRFGGDDWETGGGVVFEPEPGIHEKGLSLDWSSLYPAAIDQNISYETYVPEDEVDGDEDWLFEVPDVENDKLLDPPLYFDTRERGILPTVMEKIGRLKEEAGEMLAEASSDKEKELAKIIYDARKIAYNGGYGISNSDKSPLGRVEVGVATTSIARFANKLTAQVVKESGRDIVYGDTDSVKFRPKPDDGMEDIFDLVEAVEERVREEMAKRGAPNPEEFKLEWEHVYEPLLLPSAEGEESIKKKYAYRLIWEDGEMLEKPKRKVKGFWMVRRECSDFTREVMGEAFDILLMEREGPMAMHEYIREVYRQVQDRQIQKERIAKRKPLNKDPLAYKKRDDGTPHYWLAAAAHENNKFFDLDGEDRWRAGDRPYGYALKESPPGFESNWLLLRHGEDIPDGFAVDWTKHAHLMTGSKMKRVYQALGIDHLREQLGEGGLQDSGFEVDPAAAVPAEAMRSDVGETTVTSQQSVADFL